MTFKNLDDIEREKHERERAKFKEDISEDITDVLGRIKSKMSKPKKKPFFSNILKKIMFGLFLIGLLVLVVNFVLGNVWLLKFFIKSLFLKN